MDELTRLIHNLDQLTKRVDELSVRLAIAETVQSSFKEDMKDLKEAMDRWNNIGKWLITLVGGWLIIQVLTLIQNAS